MKTTCLLAVTIAFVSSCDKKPAETTVSTNQPSAALSAVIDAPPSGEAKSIAAVRTTAKPGDKVTLSGRIMGNAMPFVDGRAAFILGDPDILTACNDVPGDNCGTPWDACCDSPEDKKRGIVTIQILGPDGRVLKEPIEGTAGIEKLASVTVSGKVAEGSSEDLLIVNAEAIRAGR
jgi:hypothetical protein